jgi:hypothetical protein
VTFGLAVVLYLLTAQRGAGWQDTGRLQWRVWTGDYHGTLGLALAHPLYVAAGRVLLLLAGRHFAFAMNCFTGVGTAVALANLAAVTAFLTRRRWAGLAAAAMLAVTHTVWWLSTVTEAGYTWSIAGLTAELWLLARLVRRPRGRTLAVLAFVNGLGLCVHNFALLPLPVYAAVAAVLAARRKLRARSLAAAAGAYVLGAGLYIGMTVEVAVRTGDAAGAVGSALFGKFADEVLNVSRTSRQLAPNAALAAINFVSLLLPLAIVGWTSFRRRLGGMLAAALGAVTILHAAFAARYPVDDQFMFLLPTLVMVGLAGGIGAADLADRSRRWRAAVAAACCLSVALPPAFYAAAPALARAAGADVLRSRRLPFRDELRYWLVPWKHDEDSAERFAAAALAEASPHGVILAGSTSGHVLRLVRARDDAAPGVTVQFAGRPLPTWRDDLTRFRAALGGRPVYVIAGGAAAEQLAGAAELLPTGGVLERVEWKQP